MEDKEEPEKKHKDPGPEAPRPDPTGPEHDVSGRTVTSSTVDVAAPHASTTNLSPPSLDSSLTPTPQSVEVKTATTKRIPFGGTLPEERVEDTSDDEKKDDGKYGPLKMTSKVGKFGIIKYDNKFLVAELKDGELVQVHLCDKRPQGKFYAAHEKVKGRWVKPKTGVNELWPVLLPRGSVDEVMPFSYDMTRENMTPRFREHAKKFIDLVA